MKREQEKKKEGIVIGRNEATGYFVGFNKGPVHISIDLTGDDMESLETGTAMILGLQEEETEAETKLEACVPDTNGDCEACS